jgi:hypothetical protein
MKSSSSAASQEGRVLCLVRSLLVNVCLDSVRVLSNTTSQEFVSLFAYKRFSSTLDNHGRIQDHAATSPTPKTETGSTTNVQWGFYLLSIIQQVRCSFRQESKSIRLHLNLQTELPASHQ